jgi:hypothetical protein
LILRELYYPPSFLVGTSKIGRLVDYTNLGRKQYFAELTLRLGLNISIFIPLTVCKQGSMKGDIGMELLSRLKVPLA